jgi:hypothetical protein
MTEPPLKMIFQRRFHIGSDLELPANPSRQIYGHTSKQVAFRAMTSGKTASQLLHASSFAPDAQILFAGGWLIADSCGIVTAHHGQNSGGGPWQLADAMIPGSAGAVQAPALNGYYRDRPEEFRAVVERYETSMQALMGRHIEAVEAGRLYATMTTHYDPCFLALLTEAIDDRSTQLVLHDWLAEHDFPHVDELRSKRWNQGKWTENQLLDLLSKPFNSTRRSFSGRAV